MATLNIKNLPDRLYEQLQARAEHDRRSVAQEVAYLLDVALNAPAPTSILELRGLGKAHWHDLDAATHVERERSSWELIEDLGAGSVAIDTALFIYFIEEHPRYAPLVEPLFREADTGARRLVTSALTLLEVLVVPCRAGDRALADRYEALLTRSHGIQLVDVTRDQVRAAAQLRAATGVKTPDALQIAAALGTNCRTFVTNGRRLPPIAGLQVLQLSSYLP